MSVKKLLCGAALASLLVGQAHADLKLNLDGTATVKLANEVDLSSGITGFLPRMVVDTQTLLPVADDYKLTITLTGDATFNNFLPATHVALKAGAGGIGGQIVSTGGGNSDQTVTVLFDVTGDTIDTLNVDVPVSLTSCNSSVGVSIQLTDANNNPIEGGSATLRNSGDTAAADAVTCGSAFTASIIADDDATVGTNVFYDTKFSLASDFKNFLVQGATGTATEIEDTTTIANLSVVSIDTDVSFAKALPVTADVVGAPVAATDITNVAFNLNFDDATGFVTAPLAGRDVVGTATVAAVTTNAPVYALTVDPAAVDTDTAIALTVNGTDTPVVQQPTVTDATLDLASGFVDEAVTVTGFGADDLNLEGASFGPFDWVGDASKGTANIFRVTGVNATPPAAAITLANSSEGVNGTYTLTLDAADVSNGEYLLRASDIEAAAGSAFGRADVTFTFFTSDNLDVDRLISTGGIVTAYGNTANKDD